MAAEAEKSVLERVAAGDTDAVKICLEQFGGLVWTIARRYATSAEDAEDATQEIFVDLWKSAGRYRASRAAESTFVAMIARRRMIDRIRAAKRRPELTALPESWEPASDEHEKLETGVEAGLAARALGVLQPEQRKMVLMSVMHGLSHSEIAEATQTPLGTVKSTIRRALASVRESLEKGPAPGTEVPS